MTHALLEAHQQARERLLEHVGYPQDRWLDEEPIRDFTGNLWAVVEDGVRWAGSEADLSSDDESYYVDALAVGRGQFVYRGEDLTALLVHQLEGDVLEFFNTADERYSWETPDGLLKFLPTPF